MVTLVQGERPLSVKAMSLPASGLPGVNDKEMVSTTGITAVLDTP
jgi:hypothetical protein